MKHFSFITNRKKHRKLPSSPSAAAAPNSLSSNCARAVPTGKHGAFSIDSLLCRWFLRRAGSYLHFLGSTMDESVDYEKQGAQAIQDNWQIYKDDESWTDESQSRDERDVVTSKHFAKWGKVFRLTVSVTVASSRRRSPPSIGHCQWPTGGDCGYSLRTSGRDADVELDGARLSSTY